MRFFFRRKNQVAYVDVVAAVNVVVININVVVVVVVVVVDVPPAKMLTQILLSGAKSEKSRARQSKVAYLATVSPSFYFYFNVVSERENFEWTLGLLAQKIE